MTYLAKAAEIIKEFEGLKLKAYKWPHEKNWTIGYGHSDSAVFDGQEITLDEAESFLFDDMLEADACIEDYCDAPLTENQRAALVSFIFNLGCGNFRSSTLLKLLNYEDHAAASSQFARWNKAGGQVLSGLSRRREAEKKLFDTPDDGT